MRGIATALFGLSLGAPALAHMTVFTKSMFNFPVDLSENGPGGNPVGPISPGRSFDDWWFRGPATRAAKPPRNEVTELPAGGAVTMEIACHVQWTSFGQRTSVPGSPLDACPQPLGAEPYHADLIGLTVHEDLIAGCALAIADVENIEDVTRDNLVVFSTQRQCVKQKMTSFEVPAAMTACSGEFCIGEANWYMTGFQCKVTGSGANARAIALPPRDPVYCADSPSACVAGTKRPLYAYGEEPNIEYEGNDRRPGYNLEWGFSDGAQDDIFGDVRVTATRVSTTSSSSSTSRQEPTIAIPTAESEETTTTTATQTTTATATKTETVTAFATVTRRSRSRSKRHPAVRGEHVRRKLGKAGGGGGGGGAYLEI